VSAPRLPLARRRATRPALPAAQPAALLAVLLAVLAACASVPGTERSQLMLVPLSMEMSLGLQAWSQTVGEEPVVRSGANRDMVLRVGERIATAAKRMYPDPSREFAWEIVLIDDPKTVNAWCLPGGKMAVYSGLLEVTQDEDSLAIVVGHEVAHAVARHGAERMSQGLVFDATLLYADTRLEDMPADERNAVMQALVGIGTVGAILPYSRAHESEADELGLYLAADAGYDPRAAIGLWERMAAKSGGAGGFEFLSTHPSEATRIKRLQEAMPRALQIYEQAQRR
jgi:predicted Zn-dependent protease